MSKKVKWVAALAIPIMYVAYACTQKDPQGMVMLWASFWEACALSVNDGVANRTRDYSRFISTER